MPPIGRRHALDAVLERIAFAGGGATGIRAGAAVAVASLVVGQRGTIGRQILQHTMTQ